MMYHGKLYGKLWTKYFETSYTTDDWDALENKAAQLTKAVELLSSLADLQNGPPLEQHRKEWEETMQQVYDFLSKQPN